MIHEGPRLLTEVPHSSRIEAWMACDWTDHNLARVNTVEGSDRYISVINHPVARDHLDIIQRTSIIAITVILFHALCTQHRTRRISNQMQAHTRHR